MISLQGSLQTCKVNTGYANKIQSDRFENPNNLLCPVWNGKDNYGRVACYDSYVTKSAGCSSALDRVVVENYQRPQYFEYTALDASGYMSSAALGSPVPVTENYQKQSQLTSMQDSQRTSQMGGSVGFQYSKNNTPKVNGKCGADGGNCANSFSKNYNMNQGVREGYVDTLSNRNFQDRRNLSTIAGWKGNCYACSAGNR
jgi:hypothetical protein